MSQEKKRTAENIKIDLQYIKQDADNTAKRAAKLGDNELVKRVEKIAEGVNDTVKYLEKKLNNA